MKLGKSISVPSNTQDTLANLRKWKLVQDNSGPFRVYRDAKGNVYSSVTHILGQTSDRTGLEQWVARTDKFYGAGAAIQERDTAAKRGNMAHNQAEYLLKTAQRLARSTANICDWKTSNTNKLPYMNSDHQYVHQLGAYSLGLQNLTSLRVDGGAVVLARRTGEPNVYNLNQDELVHAEDAYLARVIQYQEAGTG
jgi:hypothetical protein